MEPIIAIILLILLMVIGVPVAFSFSGVLLFLTLIYDVNLNILMVQGYRAIEGIVLIALPMFILAGYLMQVGGIATRLIDFMESLIGRKRTGLGSAMVLGSAVFGAIAGTCTAAVASIGKIMIGPMEERGFPRGYSSALLGVSSLLGILIPPSITMILFAVVTQQSVAACFAASIGPGIVLIFGLMIFNKIYMGKIFRNMDADILPKMAEIKNPLKTFFPAVPALCIPFMILGGIYGGVFTPTEASGLAVFVSIIIGFWIYREMDFRTFLSATCGAAATTGTIMLIVVFSMMISRILASEQVPQEIASSITGLISNPLLIMITVNLFLVIVGMIIDDVSITVVIAPLFLHLMMQAGVHPVHYASIVAVSVVVGCNTPPMAPTLYFACKIGEASIHKAIGPSLLMVFTVAIPVMLITTFVPKLSLFLPRFFGLLE